MRMARFKDFDAISLLSVDDNDFNQEFVVAVFDDYSNINIFQAGNGKEALAVLDKEVIDIILLDLMMPEMDGFETLKKLKGSLEYKSIPVVVVTSKEDEKRTTYQMGADDFISKPYSPEELKLRTFNHLRIKRFSELLYDIKDDSKSENVSSENHLFQLQKAIEIAMGSQKKLLEKLGNIAHENSQRDEYMSERMGEYVKVLARLCGLNSKEIDNLYYTMSIYDIGLLRVPIEARVNSGSKAFKEYPNLGLSVVNDLEETSLIKMAKEVIVSHRENWDGRGYPNRLKGEEIPLYARIASIVDFYDELTVSRIYSRDVHSSDDALEIIKREKGIRFDPNILTLFVENFELFREVKNRLS